MAKHEQFGGGDNDVPHPDFIVPADYENKIKITREQQLKGIFKTSNGRGKFLSGLRIVAPIYPYRKDESNTES
jgi:hypothetical protein